MKRSQKNALYVGGVLILIILFSLSFVSAEYFESCLEGAGEAPVGPHAICAYLPEPPDIDCESYCNSFYPNWYSDIRQLYYCADYLDWGCCCVENICESPVVENLKIEPDWQSLEKNNLNYDEVFPLEPFVNLTISSEDESATEFLVNYTLSITYPDSTTQILEQGQKICGKNCQINFPAEDIKQDSLLKAEVQVYDSNGECGDEQGHKVAERYTPYVNLYILYIKTMNVIKDVNLVKNKPMVVRTWIQLDSWIRNPNGEKINDYIDIVNDVTVELYIPNGETPEGGYILVKEREIQKDIEKYIDTEVLKQDPVANRDKLKEYKKANETANFVGVFSKFITTGTVPIQEIKVIVNQNKEIKEANYSDNYIEKIYFVWKQKDDNFRIYTMLVGFCEGSWGYQGDSIFGLSNPNQARANAITGVNHILSSFPLDPKKTSVNEPSVGVLNIIELSLLEMYYLKKWNENPVDAREEAFKQLQRIADKTGIDLIFGVVHNNVLNYDKDTGVEGKTWPPMWSKVALISESADFPAYAHESGHLFTQSYRTKEQEICDGQQNKGFGIVSSEGWCMKQDTGEDCDWGGNIGRVGSGAIVNIWYDKDAEGCYNEVDSPNAAAGPGVVGTRCPDIMTSAAVQFTWPTKEPTYNELMTHFLV